MLFWCLTLGFVSLSTKLRLVKPSINLPNVSYNICTFLWYAKKENYLHKISMFTFKKNFFPQTYLI